MALLAWAAPAGAQLPDLVSDRPDTPMLNAYTVGGESRLLLRFNSYVHNRAGAGPLEVRVTEGTLADPVQRVGGALQAMAPAAEVVFAGSDAFNSDGHDHFHLQRAAEYSLRTADGDLVAPAAKVGFCLMDSMRTSDSAPARTYMRDCRPPAPGWETDDFPAGWIVMGVTPGWRDLYDWRLAFQWVDVSDVRPGTYALHSVANPDGVIAEDPPTPNAMSAGLPVRIPGHLAVERQAPAGATSVELATHRVEPMSGQLGAPRYQITSAPRHGTVDKPLNAWFSDPVVRYTPNDPANPVPDDLTYIARAADSEFPQHPPTARVLFGQGGDRAAISGAPAAMLAGTSVQLSAPGATSWTSTAGSVSPSGLYTAPPFAGPVTVRATNATGATDAVTIDVRAVPAPAPAPVPAGAPPGAPALVPPRPIAPTPPAVLPKRTIVGATAQHVGRFVAVSVVPGRAGRLRVVLRRGKRTVSACRSRAVAGRSTFCRLRRPRSGRGKLRVVVQLKRTDGRTVTRRVAIRRAHRH